MLYFDQCSVAINNTGITCDSASIESRNSLSPIYVLGKNGIINQNPAGPVENNFSFSYYLDLKREPNYGISSLIRNLTDDLSWSGCNIAIGGITGRNCYLTSYSLSVQPNDLVRANASYTSFRPLIGNLAYLSGNYYNDLRSYGHSWNTFILSSGYSTSLPVYKFDYSFNADWKPTYLIGKPYPVQVNLMQGNEEISVLTDRYLDIKFSGEAATNRVFYPAQDVNNGLVAYWAFDEGQGSGIRDSSPYGNHGTMYGGPLNWIDGVVSKGFNFIRSGYGASPPDGGNYVTTNYSPQFGKNFSYSAWLMQTIDTNEYIQFNLIGDLGYTARYLRFNGSGYVYLSVDEGQENGANYVFIPTLPNEWFFLTATYNGTSMTAYKNGINYGSINITGGNFNFVGNLNIGRRSISTPEFWSGKMDEVRLYNRVLTTGEIQTLYNFRGNNIQINGLGITCNGAGSNSGYSNSFSNENTPALTFDISGYKIFNVSINAQVDDFVNNKTTFRRYF